MLASMISVFFFNDTATTEIYTLSLHDALPIFKLKTLWRPKILTRTSPLSPAIVPRISRPFQSMRCARKCTSASRLKPEKRRSEEHTSELQSRQYLVCRLLLEKKKNKDMIST